MSPAGTPTQRRSNSRRANAAAAPTSLDTDELKAKIREWTATLYLTDDEVDSDGLNLHRDAMFQEVMSRSLAWCPKGAVPHVAHILSLAWGMVETNPDDIEAWKLLELRSPTPAFRTLLEEHGGRFRRQGQLHTAGYDSDAQPSDAVSSPRSGMRTRGRPPAVRSTMPRASAI